MQIVTDFSYCSGYLCPILDRCKRYNRHAFGFEGQPLWWISANYDTKKKKCPNYISKDK